MSDRTHYTECRFSSHKPLLLRLMQNDEEFLSLCQDYDSCVTALQYWTNQKIPTATQRADEYRILVKDLELEISSYIISAVNVQL